jgi:hypothetical protein
MIIQPNYALPNTLMTQSKLAPRKTDAVETATMADKVTISQAARNLAAASGANTTSVGQSRLSVEAHTNPALAEKMAHEMAYDSDMPLLNITDFLNGTGPTRYSISDQPVTEESQTFFNQESARVTSERIALFEAEKAKGTPPAEIIDKMVAYMDAQPQRYQDMIAWHQRAWGWGEFV